MVLRRRQLFQSQKPPSLLKLVMPIEPESLCSHALLLVEDLEVVQVLEMLKREILTSPGKLKAIC